MIWNFEKPRNEKKLTARVALRSLGTFVDNYKMSQKYLKKNPKITVGKAAQRQNRPTKQNLLRSGLSNRTIHKNSAKLGKMIETDLASKVSGSMTTGSLSVVKVNKNLLGRMVAKKAKKGKKPANSALAKKM